MRMAEGRAFARMAAEGIPEDIARKNARIVGVADPLALRRQQTSAQYHVTEPVRHNPGISPKRSR